MATLQAALNKTPGNRLRDLRKKRGLTQIELAALLREMYGDSHHVTIENSSISSYETNVNTPPPRVYEALADFFDVSLDYLRCLSDEPKPKARPVYHPDVAAFSERLNSLPNGLIRAVIDVSNTMIDKMVEMDNELNNRLSGLRERMVAQRGESATVEWEKQRGIRVSQFSDESS